MDSFNATYYGNGKPSDFVTRAEVYDQGQKVLQKDIRVNEYLEYKGVKFYQASYGWAPEVVVRDSTGHVVYDQPVVMFGDPRLALGVIKIPAAGAPGQQLGARVTFVPDVQGDPGNLHAGTANLVNAELSYLLFQGDLHSDRLQNVYDLDVTAMHEIDKGGIGPGQISPLPNGYTISMPRVLRYTGLQVTNAPGLAIIWASFALMLGGLLVRLYLRPFLEWRTRRAPRRRAGPCRQHRGGAARPR